MSRSRVERTGQGHNWTHRSPTTTLSDNRQGPQRSPAALSGTETHSRSITSRTGKGKHESYCWKTRVIGSEKKPRGAQRSSLPPGSQRHCRQHAQTCPPQTDGSGRSPHLGPEQARSWGFDALPRSPPTPRTTCLRPCAPGLCLAHAAGPPGPFRGRQNHQPPLTRRESMDSERVLLKMPVSGTRQVPPALMASWTRAPGTGGPRRPAPPRPCLRLARVCPLLPGSRLLPQRSTALCLRPVLHVVLSLLGKQSQGSKVNSRKKAEPAAVLPSLSPICPFLRPSKGRHFPVART